jgi:putative copper export protein
MTKVALVAAMLALAFFNLFVAMPRLRAASPKGIKRNEAIRQTYRYY